MPDLLCTCAIPWNAYRKCGYFNASRVAFHVHEEEGFASVGSDEILPGVTKNMVVAASESTGTEVTVQQFKENKFKLGLKTI